MFYLSLFYSFVCSIKINHILNLSFKFYTTAFQLRLTLWIAVLLPFPDMFELFKSIYCLVRHISIMIITWQFIIFWICTYNSFTATLSIGNAMLLSFPDMFELFNDLLHPFLSRFVTNYLSLKTRHRNYRLDKNGTPKFVLKKFVQKNFQRKVFVQKRALKEIKMKWYRERGKQERWIHSYQSYFACFVDQRFILWLLIFENVGTLLLSILGTLLLSILGKLLL